MALPSSRNTTYTAGSQVKSADLNDLQDQIVANYVRLSGGAGAAVSLAQTATAPDWRYTTPRPRVIPAIAGAPQYAGEWAVSAGTSVYQGGDSAPGYYLIPVVVQSGERITVSVALYQSSTSSGTVTLERNKHALGQFESGTSPTVVGTANFNGTENSVLALVTDHAVVEGWSYAVRCAFGAGTGQARRIYSALVTPTRP